MDANASVTMAEKIDEILQNPNVGRIGAGLSPAQEQYLSDTWKEVRASMEGPKMEEHNVVSPAHYDRFNIEPITFIMENDLDFATGNVIKYVMRAPYKNGVEDLKKAQRYLTFLINKAEGDPLIPND